MESVAGVIEGAAMATGAAYMMARFLMKSLPGGYGKRAARDLPTASLPPSFQATFPCRASLALSRATALAYRSKENVP